MIWGVEKAPSLVNKQRQSLLNNVRHKSATGGKYPRSLLWRFIV